MTMAIQKHLMAVTPLVKWKQTTFVMGRLQNAKMANRVNVSTFTFVETLFPRLMRPAMTGTVMQAMVVQLTV